MDDNLGTLFMRNMAARPPNTLIAATDMAAMWALVPASAFIFKHWNILNIWTCLFEYLDAIEDHGKGTGKHDKAGGKQCQVQPV